MAREYSVDGMEPGVEAAVAAAVEQIKQLGAEVVEVSLPHTELCPGDLLHHRAGRGKRQPGPVRRRALWPVLRRRRI